MWNRMTNKVLLDKGAVVVSTVLSNHYKQIPLFHRHVKEPYVDRLLFYYG